MKRQTLDQLCPDRGTCLRVFFPHNGGIRNMVATGNTKPSSDRRSKLEHQLDGEWVPGWYVAQVTGRVSNPL